MVGRTGYEVASFMLSPSRLNNICAVIVLFDGVDTSPILLSILWYIINFMHQEPICFVGSWKFNPNPFQSYSDNKMWSVIVTIQMNCAINHPDKLNILI